MKLLVGRGVVQQRLEAAQRLRILEQQIRTCLGQQQLAHRHRSAAADRQHRVGVHERDPRTGQTDLGSAEQMNRAHRIHRDKRFRPRFGRGVIDVQVRTVFQNQNAFFPGDRQHAFTAPLGERKPCRIVAVRHRVVAGHEVAGGAGRVNLGAKRREIWSFVVHFHAVDRGALIQCRARQETRIRRRIGDVGHRPARPFEHRANEADATGGANGGNQPLWPHRDPPVMAIHTGKTRAHAGWAERVGVAVGLAQKLTDLARIVHPFLLLAPREVRLAVGDIPARIGDFRMRIARAQVMDFQPLLFGDGAQIRQRRGHLPGHGHGLLAHIGGAQGHIRRFAHDTVLVVRSIAGRQG